MAKVQSLAKAPAPKNDDDMEIVGAQHDDGSAVAAAPGTPGGFTPKIKKILTLPLLKLVEGSPVYIKFTAPTFIGKDIQEEGKAKKEPPIMANVVNLATGELVQIMLGSVLQGVMKDEYPNNAYVGKGFEIMLTEKKRGRSGGNYNTYKVAELDL